MHFILPDNPFERREVLAAAQSNAGAKFAIFSLGGEFEVLVFDRSIIHSQAAKKFLKAHAGSKFIGAGFVFEGVPSWGSESCRQDFGLDRPTDAAEQQRLFDEFRSSFAEEL